MSFDYPRPFTPPPAPEPVPPVQFDADTFCFLCRLGLPWTSDPGIFPHKCSHEAEPWEFSCVAFFNLAGPHERPQVHALPVSLERLGWIHYPRLVLRAPDGTGRAIHVKTYRALRTEDQKCAGTSPPLFFAHAACWKIVQRQDHSQYSNLGMYKLAAQLRPIHMFETRRPSESLRAASFTLPEGDTNCARLVARCALLPQEMQSQILGYLACTLVSSLAVACHTANSFFDLVDQGPVPVLRHGDLFQDLPMDTYTPLGLLMAKRSYLFGSEYLRDIKVVPRAPQDGLSPDGIIVRTDVESLIQFSLGLHGLCALRVLYQDGTSSTWLGDPSAGCHGTEAAVSLRKCTVIQDNIKVLRVGGEVLAQNEAWDKWPDKLLVDGDVSRLVGHDLRLLEISHRPKRPIHYPRWRHVDFLSMLDADGNYATGLTVDCLEGMSGLTIHWPDPTKSVTHGRRRRKPMYFPLAPRERIVAAATVQPLRGDYSIENENRAGLGEMLADGLMVWTNLGRSCYFGCVNYVNPPLVSARQSFITPEWGGQGLVGGIFTTFSGAATGYRWGSIGCAFDRKNDVGTVWPETPNVHVFDQRRYLPTFFKAHEGALTTKAMLWKVARLQMQRIGGRCRGLFFDYQDGGVEALGLWDPSRTDCIEDVPFDVTTGFPSISFHYSGESAAMSRVVDISAGLRVLDDQDYFRTETFEESDEVMLAWHYTADYDWVGRWESTRPLNPMFWRYDPTKGRVFA